MNLRQSISVCLSLVLWVSTPAFALSISIEGVELASQEVGGGCIFLEGEYPGLRIVSGRAGQKPRICTFSHQGRVNWIGFHDVTFIATQVSSEPFNITFRHTFPDGPSARVYARSSINGFFATESGVGVPTGSVLNQRGLFSQAGHDDVIGDAFSRLVGDDLDSALFEVTTEEEYVITGPRTLKGVLLFKLSNVGARMVLQEGTHIVVEQYQRRH